MHTFLSGEEAIPCHNVDSHTVYPKERGKFPAGSNAIRQPRRVSSRDLGFTIPGPQLLSQDSEHLLKLSHKQEDAVGQWCGFSVKALGGEANPKGEGTIMVLWAQGEGS